MASMNATRGEAEVTPLEDVHQCAVGGPHRQRIHAVRFERQQDGSEHEEQQERYLSQDDEDRPLGSFR